MGVWIRSCVRVWIRSWRQGVAVWIRSWGMVWGSGLDNGSGCGGVD